MYDKPMNQETETKRKLDRIAIIFMALVAGISLLAITGWLLNKPSLASFSPAYLPMAPATAVIFLGFLRFMVDAKAIR